MSRRNGDRARFQKDRKRKLRHRQRIQALTARVRTRAKDNTSTRAASAEMLEEGGQLRSGD
jgi:hypothetical protein